MRVGIFIPKTSRMLLDLVVEHLSREADMDVQVLAPDPSREGRAPVGLQRCDVLVFTCCPEGARGIGDICPWNGCGFIELLDEGRTAVFWNIALAGWRVAEVTPQTLVDTVREAGSRERLV